MSQQEQIQSKYKELKELLENPELTDNQKEEIHNQMQKLSDLYSHNKATLATLTTNISGEKEIHVDKNINTENSKSKNFSFKKFMI
jgi:negative regulator of replication initiation